jgi:hypothetical protein
MLQLFACREEQTFGRASHGALRRENGIVKNGRETEPHDHRGSLAQHFE